MNQNISRRQLGAFAGAGLVLAAVSGRSRSAITPRQTLRIGQSLPLTGPLAALVKPVVEGQNAVFDEVNRKGGINGVKLELIVRDDGNDPQRVVENAGRLMEEDQVISLFGLANAAGVAGSLPMIGERKIPLVGIYAGADIVRTKHHPYFFTTTASFRDEVVQMVRTLTTVGSTRLGVACMTANNFDRWMLPMVEQVARELGATITLARPMAISGEDAVPVAQAIAATRPHAVLLLGAGPCVPAFLKASRQAMGVPVYSLSIAATSASLAAMGDESRGLVVTQVVPFPWRQTTSMGRQFNQAMERLKLPVGYDRMWGYVNASVLVEGLRRAGRSPGPANLVSAMEGMAATNLGGYDVAYSPANHHGSRFVEITIVGANGQFRR